MVSVDEEAYKVKPFVEKNKYVVPVLFSDGKIEADYKLDGTPTTLMIDAQGVVQFRHIGYSPGSEEDLKKKLDELLRPTGAGGQ